MVMKYILIGFIKVYQMMPLKTHRMCKYTPTCSEYGIEALTKFGALKGSVLTFLRVIRCNPFSKGGYDPVKRRNL